MDLGNEFIVFTVASPVLPVGIEHEECSQIHKHSNIWAMLPCVPSEYHNLHGISSEQQRDCRYRVFFLQFCSSLYTFADEHNLASTIFFLGFWIIPHLNKMEAFIAIVVELLFAMSHSIIKFRHNWFYSTAKI